MWLGRFEVRKQVTLPRGGPADFPLPLDADGFYRITGTSIPFQASWTGDGRPVASSLGVSVTCPAEQLRPIEVSAVALRLADRSMLCIAELVVHHSSSRSSRLLWSATIR
jgi:hypothetical protein